MKTPSNLILIALFSFTISLPGLAAEKAFYPYSKKAGDCFKNLPEAKKGGTLYSRFISNPRVLIPIITSDVDSENIVQLIHAPLMKKDLETGDYFPVLAEKMEVTPDYRIATYTLRKDAVWDDGSPITADDAEFTYKVLMDPKSDTAPARANFEGYRFEKIDQRSFKFLVDKPTINTLVKIHDDFRLLQKKQFVNEADINKAKGFFQPVGSGPYKLKSFSRDQKIELERNKEWWGWKLPQFKNIYNFDAIVFRIISDTALAYEKFIKGEIDVIEMNAEMFGTRVKGSDKDKFGTGPDSGKEIWATLHKTSMPSPYTYIGWNQKHDMFSSKKTRQALGMLIDYDQIIEKAFHNVHIRRNSPFGSLTQNVAPDQAKKVMKFNPAKANAILKEDGWADKNGDGVIEKTFNGKTVKFEFTLRYNSENPMRAKVAQMVKEHFKKAGIMVNVQAMEWNAYIAEVDNHNFDAFIMGWGKGYDHPDPRQLWHSSSFDNKGSNHGGYSNPEVDKLIDQANAELIASKRYKIMQKIGALIYDDQPYAFLSEMPGYLAAYHSKLKAPKWAMKYDDSPAHWLFSIK